MDVIRLTGVYDADGGLRGELAYVLGRLRGNHCGLCDITHSGVSAKASWKACVAGVGVPFAVVHRNERSADVAAATAGREPCVVAHTADGGLVVVLDADALDACRGDVDRFAVALAAALDARGLLLAAATPELHPPT